MKCLLFKNSSLSSNNRTWIFGIPVRYNPLPHDLVCWLSVTATDSPSRIYLKLENSPNFDLYNEPSVILATEWNSSQLVLGTMVLLKTIVPRAASLYPSRSLLIISNPILLEVFWNYDSSDVSCSVLLIVNRSGITNHCPPFII